jgi:hypothetical protein
MPWRFTTAQLAEIQQQIGGMAGAASTWGSPSARGGKVFRDVRYYKDEELRPGFRVAIGGDLPTARRPAPTTASSLCWQRSAGSSTCSTWRGHVEPRLRAGAHGQRGGAGPIPYYGLPLHAYLAGTELGVAQHFVSSASPS